MTDNLPTGRQKRTSSHLISVTPELGNKPKKSGHYPLYIRITENRKPKRVYLGFDIPLKDWNDKKKEVRRSNPFYKRINETIQSKRAEVVEIKAEVKNVTATVIADNLKGKSSEYFFQFAYAYAARQSFNTRRNITSEINKFREFVKNDSFAFADLSVSLLTQYQYWLKTEKGNNLNTVHMGLSKLRAIINKAIQEGVIPIAENPFLYFKLVEGKPERVRLTEAELQKLIEVELPEGSLLWNARNYWLFAFYGAGIRFSDVACMKWNNIAEGRLSYLMRKTQHITMEKHSVPLSAKALDIVQAYKTDTTKADDYIFPILNQNREYKSEDDLLTEISRKNALINKYLKMVCQKAGIDKPLSFHGARHTFADLGRRIVGDVYVMSKLLRHKKLATTVKYFADSDTENQDKAMNAIFGN